jgi:hypothetical protein
MLERMLVGDIQQHLRGIVGVEPTITGWFHNDPMLPNSGCAVQLGKDAFSHVR